MIQMAALGLLISLATSSCGFRRKAYENPITKDTQQPDKILYDRAIKDIEHSRFEVARLTFNTLINTTIQRVSGQGQTGHRGQLVPARRAGGNGAVGS
jgi:hypothetical protein